ncbi:TPA: PTS fructose transporter subunit IIA, partial [Escherichia coli JJ2555]|nr:PTS fructose transporter subunit IIA [Escherichia coli JJ2555]
MFYQAHLRDYKNDQVRTMMNLTTLTHRDALCLNVR